MTKAIKCNWCGNHHAAPPQSAREALNTCLSHKKPFTTTDALNEALWMLRQIEIGKMFATGDYYERVQRFERALDPTISENEAFYRYTDRSREAQQ